MLTEQPPENDGLEIPEVGPWSRDKHHFLQRYAYGFTNAMKDKRWKGGLHYIDLFAGAGIEKIRKTGELQWGSPFIAALNKWPFDGLHFCELDPVRCDALAVRLERLCISAAHPPILGDCNKNVQKIIKQIPKGSLSLTFLDPYGLDLHFETLRRLANLKTDLILFFPDRLDIQRNWNKYYKDNPESNLDRFLGPGADWRSILTNVPPNRQGEEIRKLYERQIQKLGYSHFIPERIYSNRGSPLYQLIFCSEHPVAAKIWSGISKKKPDGQTTFDFRPPE